MTTTVGCHAGQARRRRAWSAWPLLALLVLGGCGLGASSSTSAVYGADVSASSVDPCRLLTAAEANDALPGSKYVTGRRAAGSTGIPLCSFKDEALGGLINVLVQGFSNVEGWRSAAALSLQYQGGLENGPWDEGRSGCLNKDCEVDFIVGSVGVTVLAVPGSLQAAEGDYAAGLGVLARKAAGRFKRSASGSGALPQATFTPEAPPPSPEAAVPDVVSTYSPDASAASLSALLETASLPVYLYASKGEPDAYKVTVRGARQVTEADGTVTLTATVRNDGSKPIHPAIALVFARSDYPGQDRDVAIDTWYGEGQPESGNCIAPGGSAPILWSGEIPAEYDQVLLEDSTTRSNDC